MKNEGFDKNIITIALCVILPLILVIVMIAINEGKNGTQSNIQTITYVHVFYVKGTEEDKKVKAVLEDINQKFEVITHDITDESELYKKVLDYFKIEEKVYNPLIVINDKYFVTDYEKEVIEDTIIKENDFYKQKDLTYEDLLRYDIVDRLSSGEEVLESEQ